MQITTNLTTAGSRGRIFSTIASSAARAKAARPTCRFNVKCAREALPCDQDSAQSRRRVLVGLVGFVGAQSLTRADVARAACDAEDGRCLFEGTYSDPFHPTGQRTVSVSGDTATVTGTDKRNGAEWTIEAAVSGPEMLIDFGVKGGPNFGTAGKPAKFACNKKQTKCGILFPDGNLWTKDMSNE